MESILGTDKFCRRLRSYSTMAVNKAIEVQPEGALKTPVPTFLLTHHFPANFQTSSETAAAARIWFASLGQTMPGPGQPSVDNTRRLGDCGTEPERRIAYTLVSTDNLEGAIAVARAWPPLARGGGVEVHEIPVLTPSVQATTRVGDGQAG